MTTPPTCCTRCGAACACAVPHCLDCSLARTGEYGLVHATLAPDAPPVPLAEATAWTLRLTDVDGRPIADAAIAVSGGMPQRGLRFPGMPSATPLGEGRHRISGLVFAQAGWWVVRCELAWDCGRDAVTFNVVVE